jgi:hypothetical protein
MQSVVLLQVLELWGGQHRERHVVRSGFPEIMV